jgi:acyl-CoA thioester hydrolase
MTGVTAAKGWDLPEPYTACIVVEPADIDAYRHVNNAVYVRWLDQAAWAHSASLGLPLEHYLAVRRGMAVWRTQLHYLAPALAGDRVLVSTWLVLCDGRLRVDRRFQVRRERDGQDLLRALIHYVCIDLDDGRARRMPAEFASRYQPLPAVSAAVKAAREPFLPGLAPPGT